MQKTIVIPHAHPSLPGHFPGDPVVPGAVLLDEVIHALAEQGPDALRVTGIVLAKFTAPLRPGEECLIQFTPGAGMVKFTCSVLGRPVASGGIARSAA